MLPKMSGHVADGRLEEARTEFGSAVGLVSSVIVPAGLLLMVLGPAVTTLIFSWGNMTATNAPYIGNVLQVFGLALVPFSIFQLLLRVFYSFGDTRTPAVIAGINVMINATLSVVAYFTLPPRFIVIGLAFAFMIAYVVGGAITWVLASRRVGGLGGREIAVALSRMFIAATPGALVALFVLWLTSEFTEMNALASAIVLAAGGGLGLLIYLVTAHRMRISEVGSIIGLVAGRLRR
jgi:putative peptidoglycan lipid II flippase